MKERPIIMSAESVRAILAGRKTQTRRVFKFPDGAHRPDTEWVASVNPDGKGDWIAWGPTPVTDEASKRMYPDGGGFRCPYGRPGDRLWVKETLWKNGGYAATDPPNFENEAKTPSIYCSRLLSRITLDVLNVRVEQLTDIDNEGALAEGVDPAGYGETVILLGMNAIPAMSKVIFDFAVLWNKLNKKKGFGWHQNPWVWMLEFAVILPDRIEDGRDERVERDNYSRAGPIS